MRHSNRVTLRYQQPLPAGSEPARGRLLLLEPDELTRWSITTYLQRWFIVEAADSSAAAQRLVCHGSFSALVLSEQLTDEQILALQRAAAGRNPQVTMVRMVTGASEAGTGEPETVQLEKPFELAALAQLLGIPEQEIKATATDFT